MIFRSEREKNQAILDEIKEVHETGRPILVGTTSIEKSEELSEYLSRFGIAHQVLNAKYHEREAEIVAQAGRKAGVTIATNMAGRGTDIILGGNPEFMAWADLKSETDEDGRPKYETRLDVPKDVWQKAVAKYEPEMKTEGARSPARADCTSSAPSVTKAAASTTSFAAEPAARATPVRRGSSSRSKTT